LFVSSCEEDKEVEAVEGARKEEELEEEEEGALEAVGILSSTPSSTK
jgi:hypothetical protein